MRSISRRMLSRRLVLKPVDVSEYGLLPERLSAFFHMPQRILIFLQPVFHFNQTVDVRLHRLQPLIKRMQRFFVGARSGISNAPSSVSRTLDLRV